MIGWIMGGLLVLAVAVWCGTWIIQIIAVLAVLLFRLILMLAQGAAMLAGSIGWCVWWCFDREAARASLRTAELKQVAFKNENNPSGP